MKLSSKDQTRRCKNPSFIDIKSAHFIVYLAFVLKFHDGVPHHIANKIFCSRLHQMGVVILFGFYYAINLNETPKITSHMIALFKQLRSPV